MALQSTGNQSSGFSQQGSVDWVRLAEKQISFSISVLHRFASAGVDALTTCFAQAMCTAIPIGHHGEKFVHESLQKLHACSSFGDFIWFGVGVEHVLRTLIKTSQGCSLVALCATLTEGYSNEASAIVLRELAKQIGGPPSLTPSYPQWTAIVKVASSVFTNSPIGPRIKELSRLSECSENTRYDPSHPEDLARAILSIARIVTGEVETITIIGGPACSWIAAWAEIVLSLRVEVYSTAEKLISAEYDTEKESPQVRVEFKETRPSDNAILFIGSTIEIRSGTEFMKKCANKQDERHPAYYQFFGGLRPDSLADHFNFSGGRVDWTDVLGTAFGSDFDQLRKSVRTTMKLTRYTGLDRENLQCGLVFSKLLVSGSALLMRNPCISGQFLTLVKFWQWAFQRIPELRQFEEYIIDIAQGSPPSFSMNVQQLTVLCGCADCERGRDRATRRRRSCFVKITETCLVLLYLCSGMISDPSLKPNLRGVRTLYDNYVNEILVLALMLYSPSVLGHDDEYVSRLRAKNLHHGFNHHSKFEAYLALFGGPSERMWLKNNCSAASNGKIYVYVDMLTQLTDDPIQAQMMNIGIGEIEFQSKPFPVVYDGPPTRNLHYRTLGRPEAGTLDLLSSDSSSEGLKSRAMAEEQMDRVSFWYQLSSPSGKLDVSPVSLTEKLIQSSHYWVSNPMGGVEPYFDGSECIRRLGGPLNVVKGEGMVDTVKDCHILRPLRGNVLGRCV